MSNKSERFSKRPSPTWSKEKKLEWRRNFYAAMGPNCPNGHPWSENAKYNYREHRFCDACVRAKAEARRNDPATYSGACPRGHAYTLENTTITSWNTKFCNTCCRKPDAKARPLQPGQMDELLLRARSGATVNELAGEGRPYYRGKGIVSRLRLLAAASGDTPEASELRALLKQNAEAAVGNGRPLYRWCTNSIALLTRETEKGTPASKITSLINLRFGRDFNETTINSKTHRLGLHRPARIAAPKPPKLPPLSTALRFPTGSLLDRINTVVPRHLTRDQRDQIISDMAIAVVERPSDEAEILRRVREFVRSVFNEYHNGYRTLSLDIPLFDGSNLRRIDMITETIWQQG